MKTTKKLLSLLLVMAMIFALAVPVMADEGEYAGKTVILHSNDVHGNIAGYAYMTALKADYVAKGADVIMVDAGDFTQGTCYVSSSMGASAVQMMNAAGYDIATLGNHEFDYGWAQLKANLEEASFKVLCADVFDAEGKNLYDGHTIIEKGGVKIGFFGMETPEAQTKVNPALIKGLDFLMGDAIFECAQAEVDALKAEGADVVICVGHLGLDAESEPYRSIDMLDTVTGIDMVIDGHSHTVISDGIIYTTDADGKEVQTPFSSDIIQSTGTAFANIGVIVIDNATKAIENNFLVAIGDKSVKDEKVAAAAQAIIDKVDAEYGVVFAKSEVELNGDKAPGNRNMETNNGDLITDSMYWYLTNMDGAINFQKASGVVAITNGGGIRAAIGYGDVTKKDVNTVLPFGNTIAVVYVTGAELLEALEASTYCTPTSVGGFPQVSGINFTVDTDKAYDPQDTTYPGSTYFGPKTINRVTIEDIGGAEFNPEATYAVITNNFCAAGGDTYYAFAAATDQYDTGVPLDEALMEYITEELGGVIGEEYAGPQGRIDVCKNHSYATEVVAPTCTEMGYTLHKCAACGSSYKTDFVAKLGHHFVDSYVIPRCLIGTFDGVFSPENAGLYQYCDRCEEVIYTPAEANAKDHSDHSFKDIDGWYHDYVLLAQMLDLVNGRNKTTFDPLSCVSRQEFTTMLFRLFEYVDGEYAAPAGAKLSFTDAKDIAAWAEEAVIWGVENGIIKGYPDGSFGPNKNITRAEMATMLYRFIELFVDAEDLAAVPSDCSFTDIASSFAKTEIGVIANLGVVNGRGTSTFVPDGTLLRGEAAKVLITMFNVFVEPAEEEAVA